MDDQGGKVRLLLLYFFLIKIINILNPKFSRRGDAGPFLPCLLSFAPPLASHLSPAPSSRSCTAYCTFEPDRAYRAGPVGHQEFHRRRLRLVGRVQDAQRIPLHLRHHVRRLPPSKQTTEQSIDRSSERPTYRPTRAIPCHAMPCRAILRRLPPSERASERPNERTNDASHPMPRRAVLYYAMPCHAVPCRAMPPIHHSLPRHSVASPPHQRTNAPTHQRANAPTHQRTNAGTTPSPRSMAAARGTPPATTGASTWPSLRRGTAR